MEIIGKSFQTDRRSSFNLLKHPASHGNASHYGTKWVEKVDFVLCFAKPLNNPYQKSINRWHGQNDIVRPILPPGSDWTIWQLHVWHRWSFQVSIILLNCSWSCLGASLSLAVTSSDVSFERAERATGSTGPQKNTAQRVRGSGLQGNPLASPCALAFSDRDPNAALLVDLLSYSLHSTMTLGCPALHLIPEGAAQRPFVPAIHTFARLPHSALKSVWPFKRCYQMLRVHWNTLNTVYLKLKVKGSITVFLTLKST